MAGRSMKISMGDFVVRAVLCTDGIVGTELSGFKSVVQRSGHATARLHQAAKCPL